MDFRKVLLQNGIDVCKQSLVQVVVHSIQAEFVGGVLVCDDGESQVAVRKTGESISLEGGVSEQYYRVRELLYQQFAVI